MNKIIDTKKPFLDKLVINNQEKNEAMANVEEVVYSVLNHMSEVFDNNDTLLRMQSPITVYYILFRLGLRQNMIDRITRDGIEEFNVMLEHNRHVAERDIAAANFDYLEYDRLSQQGTNDASSIKERTRIISHYFGIESDIR
ncbi:MAG: hypothetical protein EON98_11125 [Chitinophagaceae bacterium]|nr:MAG: hypothetical protein EON98_11125 [Chitinophagaceae bacterium]